MKYYIDQSFDLPWSNYDVVTEDGGTAFRVEAQASLGHHLDVFDGSGHLVGKLAEKLEIVPTYLAWENGVQCGSIQRKLAFPKPKMVIDYKDWEIGRDFRNLRFDIKDRAKQTIAKIDREKWRMQDHYVMDVAHEEDALTVLLLVLAVSAIREETKAGMLTSAILP